MHDKRVTTRFGDSADKPNQPFIIVHIVNTYAVLDGNRNFNGVLHCSDTFGDQLWLSHQASANHTVLYPITRAAAVEIHFIVAPALGNASAFRESDGITTAQLQCQWMLAGVVIQKTGFITMQ